jgi:hypothetical protein
VYFMGALGLYWSARCRDSWRSLVATLATGYGYGFAIFLLGLFTFGQIGVVLMITLLFVLRDYAPWRDAESIVVEFVMPVSICLGVSGLLWNWASSYLRKAENWVAVRERAWSDDNRLHFTGDEFRRLCLGRDREELRRTS